MKKLLVVFILTLFVGLNVYADITIEILDQDTPTAIYNGEYRELLEVQISTDAGELLQLRCATFFINNTFSWLEDLRFEQLQWKIGDDWVSPVKTNSEWDVTTPCWAYCLPNETITLTLWGKVVSVDVLQGQEEFQIGWEDADYLWLSGDPIIENNFPQHKNIIIIGNTASDNNEISEIDQIRNYPNPFNPRTMISFYLSSAEDVKLEIYNIKGQKVKTLINKELQPGQHQISWNGTNDSGQAISSGIYFYKMKAGKCVQTKKMILTK